MRLAMRYPSVSICDIRRVAIGIYTDSRSCLDMYTILPNCISLEPIVTWNKP
jgi:hypothetical protein